MSAVALHRSEVVLYQPPDRRLRLPVRFDSETAWLSLPQLASLLAKGPSEIAHAIDEIFTERELDRASAVRRGNAFGGDVTNQLVYCLDVVISVGYRVRSPHGTPFRQWALGHLRQAMLRAVSLGDPALGGGEGYFEELLAAIRDIRSSEKVFWRKLLDIYATSVDYDPNAESSQRFFSAVQNKMHWAAHGHTAAEVIAERADADSPNMGLTSWAKDAPRKADALVAKNYLQQDELVALNRIVAAYLEMVELAALQRRPMSMADWMAKLDGFLALTDRPVLGDDGEVSREEAMRRAEEQYERYAIEREAAAAAAPARPSLSDRRAGPSPARPRRRAGAVANDRRFVDRLA